MGGGQTTEEMQKTYEESRANALRVFRDRVYILGDLPLDEFADRWHHTASLYMDMRIVRRDYEGIRMAIVKVANRAVPRSRIMRVLLFWKR